jgi:hypothetical protein
METVHKATDSDIGHTTTPRAFDRGFEGGESDENSMLNVKQKSVSAKPNEPLVRTGKDAISRDAAGLGEVGKMEAKLQELNSRKMELANLQAKVEEDITTLRNALGLLEA